MRAHLSAVADGGHCPTGDELHQQLLEPLAATSALAGRIRLRHRVRSIARGGLLKHEEIGTPARGRAPFRLLLDTPDGEQMRHADAVLDCTGTYANPNWLGDGGIPALGESRLDACVIRTLPRLGDPRRWRGRVLLVGAGKSAQTAAYALAELPDTYLEWVIRSPHPDWGEVPDDTLPARQALVDRARRLAAGTHDRVRVHTATTVAALRRDRPGVDFVGRPRRRPERVGLPDLSGHDPGPHTTSR